MNAVEIEALRLAARGMKQVDIAAHMQVPRWCINEHMRTARHYFKVTTTIEAIIAAVHEGVI